MAYTYMSDFNEYGMTVYSWEKNDSWRIEHYFLHFDPLKQLIERNTTIIFPQDIAIDNKYRKLYVLSENLPRFQHDYECYDPSRINFVITSANLDTLTFLCKMNRAKVNYV
ncbi:hypothetical protein X777_00299 [Ooceraea biroi]|uniref:Uncharacterized protein n=1 Tax=Ooceraea biroi TaxID=2015173 RepID=A0A026WUW6_OOCBI|nr:hypothetical protein X777_00299 [Ooceraea biroi]